MREDVVDPVRGDNFLARSSSVGNCRRMTYPENRVRFARESFEDWEDRGRGRPAVSGRSEMKEING
jgi:hypothetical protein